MLAFASRRLLAAVPLAWGVATLVFFLSLAVPGRTFHDLEGPGVTPGTAEHLRALFGADRSIGQRYVAWLRASATGDLGVSFSLRAPVSQLLREALRNSFRLAALALFLQFLLGTAVGVLAFSSGGGWLDRSLVAWASLLYSLPSFCLGIVLVGVFSLELGWLPVSQMHSIDAGTLSTWGRFVDAVRHLVLPALTLSLPAAGGIALYVREQLRSLGGKPFLPATRARGASPLRVMLAHALRNALLPIVTLLGLSLPGLVGGATVVEVLYSWPGMGRLAYHAVLARDEPLILGCTLVASFAVIAGSLVADLAARAVDPRIEGSAA